MINATPRNLKLSSSAFQSTRSNQLFGCIEVAGERTFLEYSHANKSKTVTISYAGWDSAEHTQRIYNAIDDVPAYGELISASAAALGNALCDRAIAEGFAPRHYFNPSKAMGSHATFGRAISQAIFTSASATSLGTNANVPVLTATLQEFISQILAPSGLSTHTTPVKMLVQHTDPSVQLQDLTRVAAVVLTSEQIALAHSSAVTAIANKISVAKNSSGISRGELAMLLAGAFKAYGNALIASRYELLRLNGLFTPLIAAFRSQFSRQVNSDWLDYSAKLAKKLPSSPTAMKFIEKVCSTYQFERVIEQSSDQSCSIAIMGKPESWIKVITEVARTVEDSKMFRFTSVTDICASISLKRYYFDHHNVVSPYGITAFQSYGFDRSDRFLARLEDEANFEDEVDTFKVLPIQQYSDVVNHYYDVVTKPLADNARIQLDYASKRRAQEHAFTGGNSLFVSGYGVTELGWWALASLYTSKELFAIAEGESYSLRFGYEIPRSVKPGHLTPQCDAYITHNDDALVMNPIHALLLSDNRVLDSIPARKSLIFPREDSAGKLIDGYLSVDGTFDGFNFDIPVPIRVYDVRGEVVGTANDQIIGRHDMLPIPMDGQLVTQNWYQEQVAFPTAFDALNDSIDYVVSLDSTPQTRKRAKFNLLHQFLTDFCTIAGTGHSAGLAHYHAEIRSKQEGMSTQATGATKHYIKDPRAMAMSSASIALSATTILPFVTSNYRSLIADYLNDLQYNRHMTGRRNSGDVL